MTRGIKLITEGRINPPTLDTAISRATLFEVSAGRRDETLRIHRPGRIMAFGKQDVMSPTYQAAVTAAREAGFAPVERLAGGRAAVFHEETIAFAWSIPEEDPKTSITPRFVEISELVTRAFTRLGVSAGVGEVPGEYCPGAYSVHARGAVKLMGVGQRLTRHAAHVGGVIVVDNAELVTDAITPVYRALGLDWDPATSGSVRAEAPDTSWNLVVAALLSEFSQRYALEPTELDAALLEQANELAPQHDPSMPANT